MGRDREREPLEDGLKLDLNLLLRQGVVRKGSKRRRTIVWSQSYTGEVVATGELSSDLSGDTRGSIRMQMGDLDQLIDLIAAPRHFGGAQWYFTCPVLRCRASVLWMPPGAHCFACRKAWGSQVRLSFPIRIATPTERRGALKTLGFSSAGRISSQSTDSNRLGRRACTSALTGRRSSRWKHMKCGPILMFWLS